MLNIVAGAVIVLDSHEVISEGSTLFAGCSFSRPLSSAGAVILPHSPQCLGQQCRQEPPGIIRFMMIPPRMPLSTSGVGPAHVGTLCAAA